MRQLGWIIPTMFCGLLLWSYPAFAQRLSFREAFERAKADWQVELPYGKGYFYTCDDGFLFRAGDKTRICRYNIEGKKLWEKTDPRRWEVSPGEFIGPLGAIGISQDGRFSLGDVIWSRNLRPFLPEGFGGVNDHDIFVSDNGAKIAVIMEGTRGKGIVILFNDKGERLWEREYGWARYAYEAAFSASAKVLLVHSRHRWILVDTATGDEIWNIPEKIKGHWTIVENLLRIEDNVMFIPTLFWYSSTRVRRQLSDKKTFPL